MSIKITNEQLKKLESYKAKITITELVDHCDKNFAYLKSTLGEARLCQILTDCVNKAEQHGYTLRGPVIFYIDMLIILGIDCECDLQYPWIKHTIEKNRHLSQIDQASELYFVVIEYLEKITGNQNQYLFRALEKVQALTLNNLDIGRVHYIDNVHHLLYEIYPEKYQQTPRDNITELIKQGTKKAYYDYEFEEANQAILIVLLMFFLGHQFDHDSFYQWASLKKSNKEREKTIASKAERLSTRAKIWLTAYLKNEQASFFAG